MLYLARWNVLGGVPRRTFSRKSCEGRRSGRELGFNALWTRYVEKAVDVQRRSGQGRFATGDVRAWLETEIGGDDLPGSEEINSILNGLPYVYRDTKAVGPGHWTFNHPGPRPRSQRLRG